LKQKIPYSINIENIVKTIFDFDNVSSNYRESIDKEQAVIDVRIAKRLINSAVNALMSLIAPEKLDKIDETNYSFMMGNLGRLNARLDAYEEKILRKVDIKSLYETPLVKLEIGYLIESLNEIEQDLIFNVLSKALEEFNDYDEKLRDGELFRKLILNEMVSASILAGIITREQDSSKKALSSRDLIPRTRSGVKQVYSDSHQLGKEEGEIGQDLSELLNMQIKEEEDAE